MSRESLIMVLGLLVLFMPSLGIPSDWKVYAHVLIGVLLIIFGYSLRRAMYIRTLERADGERGNDAFVEHDGSVPRIVTNEATPEE